METENNSLTNLFRVHEKITPMGVRRTGCLFGLTPTEVRNSLVLEIGCGAGANLISLALLYPSAKFKGVDDSKDLIREARSRARKLEVKNVRFEVASLGKFEIKARYDYILVPGVYSWISDKDRGDLLGKVSEGLGENGLALFSYNTFPGWNTARAVREMMIFHTRFFEDRETKVTEARKMLNFVLANNEGKDTPYTKSLESERKLIRQLEDYYFYKEYLSDVNEPVYFSDFISAAGSRGLRYVGDMDLEFMYLGNYNELAQSQLGELTTAVQQEQYMDFIVNRRIRNTVVAKAGAVNRAIDADRLKDFQFRLKLLPNTSIDSVNYEREEVELFSPANNEVSIKVTGRERVAFIEYMVNRFPADAGISDICEGVGGKTDLGEAELKKALERFLVGGIASGLCTADRESDLFVTNLSEKPAVFAFARYQSEEQILVNNVRHQAVQVSAIDQWLMPLLDGSRDINNLVEEVKKRVESGDLNLSVQSSAEGPVTYETESVVKALIDERLRFYAVNSLLVA